MSLDNTLWVTTENPLILNDFNNIYLNFRFTFFILKEWEFQNWNVRPEMNKSVSAPVLKYKFDFSSSTYYKKLI